MFLGLFSTERCAFDRVQHGAWESVDVRFSALKSGPTAELGRDGDPAAAASHEGHAIPPMRGQATCFFTPAGCSMRQDPGEPSMHRKQALPP